MLKTRKISVFKLHFRAIYFTNEIKNFLSKMEDKQTKYELQF